ncbi:MAG: hypothetical protein AAGD38_11205 [Acidobacteriota bacterium]
MHRHTHPRKALFFGIALFVPQPVVVLGPTPIAPYPKTEIQGGMTSSTAVDVTVRDIPNLYKRLSHKTSPVPRV